MRQGVDTENKATFNSSLMFGSHGRSHGAPTLDIQTSGTGFEIELEGARSRDSGRESSARDYFVSQP